jgi:hypothetical protein
MNIEINEKKYNIDDVIFLSSDESLDEPNPDTSNKKTRNATNGINIINNNKSKIQKYMKKINNNSSSSDSDKDSNHLNGWDDDANNTINNWYTLFKQQSFIYQWILERNKKISNKLILASIISSSVLGIFASFKLWIKNDNFDTTSDLLLMLSNFSIALITGYSKSYIDDKRNELIRIYIDEVDGLLGEISAQVLKSPIYRVDAGQFFKDHNYKYTKLITYIPNISIYELNESKKEYEHFNNHFNNIV